MRHHDRSGLLFALCGFALLSVGDSVVKSMAGQWPAPAIAALRYLLGMIGLGGLLALREGRAGFVLPRPKWQVLRGFGVAFASMSFFASLAVMPIAAATSITFTSPMLTALLAAIILGEPMRRQTWIASIAAFIGVVIVLRPNFAALGLSAFLPLGSAIGMSLLMIANRAVAGRASALSMQFSVAAVATVFLALAVTAGQLSGIPRLHVGVPHWTVLARIALVAVSASGAHALIYMATTRAGAATIAPMTYVQLLGAGTLGWVVFHEVPDAMALLGATIIVSAGLYLWRASRPSAVPVGTE